MKQKFTLLLSMIFISLTFLAAQQTDGYVDVKQTNERIARLERENENHKVNIAANNERKSFLEGRIQTSEARLSKIQENLTYAQETNLELNELNKETRDKETKDKLEESRNELMSVIWILTTENTRLTDQTQDDKDELEYLTRDISRRETIIERNNGEIAPLKQSVADTESKINEISSKLDTIIGKLNGLREEVTTESQP